MAGRFSFFYFEIPPEGRAFSPTVEGICPPIRVDPRRPFWKGKAPIRGFGEERRRNQIEIVDAPWDMNPVRADMPHGEGSVRGELALNGQIPLLVIRTRWIGLDVGSTQTPQSMRPRLWGR
jgi:hypothetical protein